MAQIKTKFIENLAVTNAKIANATIDLTSKVTGILPVANGGTNSSSALNNNRILKSSGGAIIEAAAITNNSALASDANGIPVASITTDTELGFVSGVTSSIQTQLNGKANTTLNNLGSTAVNADINPDSFNTRTLGTTAFPFFLLRTNNLRASETTAISFTGDTTSGSAVIAVTNTTGLVAGYDVIGPGIPDQSQISSIVTNTSVTINNNATATATGVSLQAVVDFSIRSGDKSGTETSGPVYLRTGNVVNGQSGLISVKSANASGTGTSGQAYFRTGRTVSGKSGDAYFESGLTTGSGNSGAVRLASGASGSGTRGGVTIDGNTITLSGLGTVSTQLDINPSADNARSLGSSSLRYANMHTLSVSADASQLILNGSSISANSLQIKNVASGTSTGDALQWGQIGAANGIAGLDAGGKVPFSQLPSALMSYLGAWDASSNTPTLADGTGDVGDTYRVSVAGTQDLGSGSQTFFVGDFIIYNGTIWQRSPAADGVISVNGASGAVTVNAINQLTGDATAGPASGSQSQALTLATVNSNVGSFGSSTSIPSFTVNAKGLITAASGNVVVAPAGTLTGTTLNSTVVSSSLTSVGTIASGVWNGTTIAIANGGTGQTTAANAFAALSPLTTAGDIIIENATPAPARLAIGSSGQVLTVSGGLPAWVTPTSSTTTATEEFPTLSGTDITNQYFDLLHVAQGASATVNSITLAVSGGPEQLKGTDYTVSLTGGSGGVTRISFAGDLATGGAAALVAGDILLISYSF